MEIENLFRKLPKFYPDFVFRDRSKEKLLSEKANREQIWSVFRLRLAWTITLLVIITGVGLIYLRSKPGSNFLRPSPVMAAEIVKRSLATFFNKGTIFHQKTKQFVEGETEAIVYEIWDDMDTQRFLNHVIYPTTVYPHNGQELWQGFFIETTGSYWWEINLKEKTIRRENYIYVKEEDRWQKLGERVDLPRLFNDLIEKGFLEAKEGKLDNRDVYVVYDTRTAPEKVWDILTFDKNTFQLLRTEKYEGEGDARELAALVEYELQESLLANPDNIDKLFKSYPLETKDFKYLARDFHVSEDQPREDFKELNLNALPASTPLPQETTNQISTRALNLLKEIPEIQIIEKSVSKAGRTTFFTQENENGDVVEVSLKEGGFSDGHTTRIDTFIVNAETGEIRVYDIAYNKTISLDEWRKTVNDRFKSE